MNVKRLSSEELQETIESYNRQASFDRMSQAETDYFNACKTELARRWGIKL